MAAQRIYEQLSAVSLLVQADCQQALRPHELTPAAFALLCWLDRDGGVRQVDLAARLLLDTSTITRLIDRQERSGLVRRTSDPADRRALRVALTAEGRQRLAAARQSFDQIVARRLGGLSPAEQEQLLSLLDKLAPGLSGGARRGET